MTRYRVDISARKVGAIGQHGTERRTYEIEAAPETVNDVAIKRAYEDGDIEHVRVIRAVRVGGEYNGGDTPPL